LRDALLDGAFKLRRLIGNSSSRTAFPAIKKYHQRLSHFDEEAIRKRRDMPRTQRNRLSTPYMMTWIQLPAETSAPSARFISAGL